MRLVSRILAFLAVLCAPLLVQAQPVEVTFRYVPQPGDDVVRAFLPGEFNGWGPNAAGRIAVGAPSQMTFDEVLGQWLYTTTLQAGQTYQYKVHFHLNASGSEWVWISDPLNDRVNTDENNNSVVTITDPMAFQLARRENAEGQVVAVSAGVFGTEAIEALTFAVDGVEQDGLPFFDAETGIFHYALPEPSCSPQFRITATDAEGRVAEAEVGVLPPPVEDAPRPAGVEDGVTYVDGDATTAYLSIFAPGACFVHALGDFNGWQLDDEALMKRDATAGPDSVRWWMELGSLTPTQEYAYQYVVDGEERVADFFSEKILDPANDPFIPDATYPNLKAYPAGQTTGFVSVLQTGQSAFPFRDFERPAQHTLVIYELLVRDFLDAHSYQVLTDTLDYLDRLGVNAVELMPVAEFGGNINWGYQPQFYFAPDKYYGPAEALKAFVDEAHARGMAVILDVVYNHVDFPNPLLQLYGGAVDENPFINIPARHPFNVFFDLNHENPYTQYWLDRVNRYWLEEFNVDGFRFDLSKGFTQKNTGNDVGAWSRYDASRVALLTRMADAIWDADPTAYVILEHFGESREERELATHGLAEGRPGMMLWNGQNHAYNEATMGYHTGGKSDFSGVYYGDGGRGFEVPHLVSYMESHDEQWLMFKNLAFGACERSPTGGNACNPTDPANAGTYNVRRLGVALDRMKMAGAFFFLVPGPKMMWQFGELGYGYGDRGEQCLKPGDGSNGDCPSFAPGRTGPKPIRWDYRDDRLRAKLYRTWSTLLHLRREHPVFTDPATAVTMDVRAAVKRIILEHPTMNVYLLGNFGVTESDAVAFDFPSEGVWFEYFTGEERNSAQDDAVVLSPGEFRLYTTERLPPPEPDLITVDAEDGALPAAFRLEANYPNPFNPETTIRFTVPAPGPVRLAVYDVLGREVAVLVDAVLPAGPHAAAFDAAGLPSGPYLYRLTAAGRTQTRAMLRVR
ncbi:MAG: alpha-amylase family glycosyl hydrolase [Rhodothermales bacterium]|nr:alpha-amylase family glycosyl hydrolase [Rhodothermales bacterium]